MTWICKKCGQIQSDSIIYSDEICVDCFEKINKKKKKGSALNKILSLALVLSFMLCIFSGFGVASAEGNFLGDSSPLEYDGTYMGYNLIKYDENFSVSFAQLQDIALSTYSQTLDLYVDLILMQFDDSGKPIIYSTGSDGYVLSLKADYSYYKEDFEPYDFSFLRWYAPTSSAPKINSYSFNKAYGSKTDAYWTYGIDGSNITANIVDKEGALTTYEEVFSYTNLDEGFSGFTGSGDLYILIRYGSSKLSDSSIIAELLAGSKSDFVPNKKADYSAKFHSFASANDNVGGVQEILNMIDWIGLGNQYPTVDFSINDAGNNHSYSLRISSNKNYVDVCMALWEDYRLKRLVETSSSAIALAFTPDIISKFVLASSNGKIDGFGISSNNSNVADAVRYLAQVNLLKSIGDLSYVVEYNLTSPYLQFNEGESPSRAYSVCLPDYVTITKGLVYRLDIVDNYTGMILDTAYFCNDTTFAKTNTGYGTKVYNYSDYNDLLGDVDGGNGYVNNDSYTQGDSLQNDNPNDIVDWDKYNQYDFSNMQNLSATLNSATAGLGGFFMACFNVIPPAFISLLLGTFTLVIVLRVLGR